MMKRLWPHARPYASGSQRGWSARRRRRCSSCSDSLVMSDIVDVGIANGDQGFILRKGGVMVVMALVSLLFGLGSAVYRVAGRGLWRRASVGGV